MQHVTMPAPVVKPLEIDQRRVRLAPIPLAQAQVPKWCNDNNNSEADWTYVPHPDIRRSVGAVRIHVLTRLLHLRRSYGHPLSKAEYQLYSEYSMRKYWMHLQAKQGVIEFFLTPKVALTLGSHTA